MARRSGSNARRRTRGRPSRRGAGRRTAPTPPAPPQPSPRRRGEGAGRAPPESCVIVLADPFGPSFGSGRVEGCAGRDGSRFAPLGWTGRRMQAQDRTVVKNIFRVKENCTLSGTGEVLRLRP